MSSNFNKIKEYYCQKIKELCKKDVKVLLLGNKKDLEDRRVVSIEEGRSLALQENYKFMECSCLKFESVNEAFYELIMWSILDKKEKNGIDKERFKNQWG